jgi:serine/threonine protein phosphatase PrpC
VVSSERAVDMVREMLKTNMPLKDILSEIFDACLSPHPSANEGLGCDNMTCIIVKLKK